jgi:hypothetical protein
MVIIMEIEPNKKPLKPNNNNNILYLDNEYCRMPFGIFF